jgi:predicted dehydrogenase
VKAAVLWPKDGSVTVEELPDPQPAAGRVLIRNEFSLLSAGTERAKVEVGKQSLIGKARSRPDQVKQVIAAVKQSGLRETYRVVDDRLSAPMFMGYSTAGRVVAVGAGVTGFREGDKVAAGGGGYANHAELVLVPQNLCVPVPANVSAMWAAFATVGAIALQGVHQAEVQAGSRVGVIGLGLVGQLTVRLLDAYGCEVTAVDSDPSMVELAGSNGIAAYRRDDPRLVGDGPAAGLDAVLITAATKSADPVTLAGELARDRATVVIVGDVNVAPPRGLYYGKELSIRYSRSYGPGRYDHLYEEEGIPYPEGYVPWPQRRNMAEFVRLLAAGRLDLEGLDPAVFSIDDAAKAYDAIENKTGARKAAVLLSYPATSPEETAAPRSNLAVRPPRRATHREGGAVTLGLVGAGSFATRMLLPHLKRDDVELGWLTTGSGLTAVHQGRRWGFEKVVSGLEEGLAYPDLDCVMVLSRHDSHGPYSRDVLARGIGLYCEKPLALGDEELEAVTAAWMETGAFAMVGFNRRFAPAIQQLKAALEGSSRLQLVYRVFAGALRPDHWYFDPGQGGRIRGEVCHFVDTLNYLVPASPIAVTAWPGDEVIDGTLTQSVSACIEYGDGSSGMILYSGRSPGSAPKEFLEVSGDGIAARMDDFRSLEIWGRNKGEFKYRKGPKGHKEEMESLVGALSDGRDVTADFRLSLVSTLVTERIAEAVSTSTRISVAARTPELASLLGGGAALSPTAK